jgi:hypothetical protein
MDSDLQQRLLALELDTLTLEVNLRLQATQALPLPSPSQVAKSRPIRWSDIELVLPQAPSPRLAALGSLNARLQSNCKPTALMAQWQRHPELIGLANSA